MANRELTPWTRGGGLTPLFGGGRDPFTNFRQEMDRLFEDFFTPVEGRSFAPSRAAQGVLLWPRIDLSETNDAYTVTAELPGIDLKDVDLNLKDNVLTISGEKRSEFQEGEGGQRYSERAFGRFERAIPFETEVDVDRVEATSENGVLKVTLPKNPQAREKSRKIEIRPGAGKGGAQTSQGKGK